VRTSSASTSGSSSFEDHQGHQRMHYTVEVLNNSHIAHAALVSTFEPKDIGNVLSDHNWVNSMHEELENFETTQVWELVEPPPTSKPIWKNGCGRTKRVRMEKW
jgi:hypothetical protein